MLALLKKWFLGTQEIQSPKPRIKSSDIVYSPQTGTITISNLPLGTWLTTVQDTNSMDPVFDYGHILILTPVEDYSDLQVGDIVVYQASGSSIIHRIISITVKDGKRHYRCKGDNCASADPYDITDENITYLYRGHLI